MNLSFFEGWIKETFFSFPIIAYMLLNFYFRQEKKVLFYDKKVVSNDIFMKKS